MTPGREWLGTWESYAPLTPDEWRADEPYLQRLTNAVPVGVTIREMTVWVHGREYRWERIDVTTVEDARG